jgi:SAM-dependent methyltransferase/uncharacterized protein YbaR (Trm112 family)
VRLRHFETLRPLCPVCQAGKGPALPLKVGTVSREEDGHLLEGVLQCVNPSCLREYPIIDGIPLLLLNIREYISNNILGIYARRDLTPLTESLLGDCCGPNSTLDQVRQHLSSYVSNHYGDLGDAAPAVHPEGAILALLQESLQLAGPAPDGPALDAGCSVGRACFELAARERRLVLGVDLHFPMLRIAGEVLRTGTARYPRRRAGVVYDWRQFRARFAGSELVDFWAVDATALPFAPGTFARALGLNVLDCVTSPHALLVSLSSALSQGGKLSLTCPYDWSPGATPLETWLGGHSQRSESQGSPDMVLRALLASGEHPAAIRELKLVAERERLPWQVRLHDRSTMSYEVHAVAAERIS